MKRLILAAALLAPLGAQAVNPNDVMRLADVVYCEAKGEGRAGMIAVADVVMNRVASPKWPNSIKAVIEQPWQFTCITQGNRINFDSPYYAQAVEVAAAKLHGKTPRMTRATHYYAPSKVQPRWAKSKQMAYLGQIGNHRFYEGF